MARSVARRLLGRAVDGAVSAFWGYRCRRSAFLDRGRNTIGEAREGDVVKVVGRLRASGPPLVAPISGAACVWYRTVVQVVGDDQRPSSRKVAEQEPPTLVVDDETGSALIHVPGAAFSLVGMRTDWIHDTGTLTSSRSVHSERLLQFLDGYAVEARYQPTWLEKTLLPRALLPKLHTMRFKEAILREGDRIAVLGCAVREVDPAAHPADYREPATRLVFGAQYGDLTISDEPGVWS